MTGPGISAASTRGLALFAGLMLGLVVRAPACDLLVDEVLATASVLAEARVLGYDPGGIRFETLPVTSWLGLQARPALPVEATYPDGVRLADVLAAAGPLPEVPATGSWPDPGVPVLVGVSEGGKVSLLGLRHGESMRLWIMDPGLRSWLPVTCTGTPRASDPTRRVDEWEWDACDLPLSRLRLRAPGEAPAPGR